MLVLTLLVGTGVYASVSALPDDPRGKPTRYSAGGRPSPGVSRSAGRAALPKPPTATPDAARGASPTANRDAASAPETSPSATSTPTGSLSLPKTSISLHASGAGQAPRSEAGTSRPSPRVEPASPSGSPSGSGAPPSGGASPSPDRVAPQTTLIRHILSDGTAVLTFGADEPSTFRCSVDGEPYAPCGSPETFDGLRPGWHTFSVRATDVAGNADPTPATTRWHMRAF